MLIESSAAAGQEAERSDTLIPHSKSMEVMLNKIVFLILWGLFNPLARASGYSDQVQQNEAYLQRQQLLQQQYELQRQRQQLELQQYNQNIETQRQQQAQQIQIYQQQLQQQQLQSQPLPPPQQSLPEKK